MLKQCKYELCSKSHDQFTYTIWQLCQAQINHCKWNTDTPDHDWTDIILMWVRVRVMVFNATFNNISITMRRSDLLVEEVRVPGENHRPLTSRWQSLSHNFVPSRPHLSKIQTLNFSWFNVATFLCVSQARNWISNAIYMLWSF